MNPSGTVVENLPNPTPEQSRYERIPMSILKMALLSTTVAVAHLKKLPNCIPIWFCHDLWPCPYTVPLLVAGPGPWEF